MLIIEFCRYYLVNIRYTNTLSTSAGGRGDDRHLRPGRPEPPLPAARQAETEPGAAAAGASPRQAQGAASQKTIDSLCVVEFFSFAACCVRSEI